MAIRSIKELIENKGYLINPTDRKIFEKGDLQVFFGVSPDDAIEFIIYDVNDNQLPQLNGEFVRYINLSDENIRDYFLIPDGTRIQANNLPSEYFIDVERLLNEAGYTNGIFKTQVTLINKRAGSEKEFDKLWIQEISPSRTEIRLFPLQKGIELNPQLRERYNIFVKGSSFRSDTEQSTFELSDNLNPALVKSFIEDKYGEDWIRLLINEFNIPSLQNLITTISEKFLEATSYEFSNRISDINSTEYGKPKQTPASLELSKQNIIDKCNEILIQIIDKFLPTRNIRESVETVESFDESIDDISRIKQTKDSDTTIGATNVLVEEIEWERHDDPVLEKVLKDIKEIQLPDDAINDVIITDDIVTTQDEVTRILDERADMVVLDSNTPYVATSGIDLDYTNPNEAALAVVINNTFNQTNETAIKQFFEDQRNAAIAQSEPQLDPTTSTRAGSGGAAVVSATEFDKLTTNDKLNLGRASSVVIDGKILKRQFNQL
jgi:hypothetical protein